MTISERVKDVRRSIDRYSRDRAKAHTEKPWLRRDVQGLRAFAVVAVVLDHLLHWPSGGFVGVDVFFVISGFLITGLLLREHEKTGSISFTAFYRRRVKRILPASLLTVVVTIGVAFFLFNFGRFLETFWDGVWATLFAGNWRFASSGTDYFLASGPVSPFQHFWSLSVEEQFYFVWPWLMLLIYVLVARLARGRAASTGRLIIGIVMGVIIVLSFAWAMFDTVNAPTVAYFSTFSRAWELGIGALLAAASPLLGRIPDALRPVLGWVGLLGILLSYAVISGDSVFPAPWAALPVIATALVIAAGTGKRQRFLWPLTNPVSNYIGDISYSLYLWHFPIIIFLGVFQAKLGGDSPVYYTIVFAAMALVAVGSYHLVEDPIRKSSWLDGKKRTAPRGTSGRRNLAVPLRVKIAGWVALGVASIVVFGIAFAPQKEAGYVAAAQPSAMATDGSSDSGSDSGAAGSTGPEVTMLQTEIAASLQATVWPELNPTLDSVVSGNNPSPGNAGACGYAGAETDAALCTWGDANSPKSAILVGDSIAQKWIPGLASVFGEGEWHLRTLSMFSCPFIGVELTDSAGNTQRQADCQTRKQAAIDAINADTPDLVIIANTYNLQKNAATNKQATPGEWGEGIARLIGQFSSSAGKVVDLTPPPFDKDIKSCYTPVSSPGDCVSSVKNYWLAVADAEKVAVEGAGAIFVDTRPLFCDSNGKCPSFIGTTPVKHDPYHITPAYSTKAAPGLKELLVGAGAVGG